MLKRFLEITLLAVRYPSTELALLQIFRMYCTYSLSQLIHEGMMLGNLVKVNEAFSLLLFRW